MILENIIALLTELRDLCSRYEETVWKSEVERFIGELTPCMDHQSPECRDKVTAMWQMMFGRGFALQDLAILKANGHKVVDELRANRELESIRKRLKQAFDVELNQN